MSQTSSDTAQRSNPTEYLKEIRSEFDRIVGSRGRTLLEPLIDWLENGHDHEPEDLDVVKRDPEFLAAMLPLLKLGQLYTGAEVRGFEHVPRDEPVLFVGNHSGGAMTLDPFPLILRWLESRGCEAPLYSLAYELFFSMPGLAGLTRRMGCLPASHENASSAILEGASVIVFPGGDYEVFRSWRDRNRIDFGGRTGFIELALRNKIRVVPMTIHGGHETTFVMTKGHRLAQNLGLDRLRIKVFPVVWNLPFGPLPAFVPQMPIPSKMTIQLGRPIDWSRHGSDSADDQEIVETCYAEITGEMQATMDRLAKEHPYPVLTQLNNLRPSKLAGRAWRMLRS